MPRATTVDELSRVDTTSVAISGGPASAGLPAAVKEAVAETGSEGGTTTNADDSGRNAEEGLPAKVEKLRSKGATPVWIEAYVSYYLALASGRLRPKHTQDEAYELVKEEDMYIVLAAGSEEERFGLTFGEIPTCENWKDYNRRARKLLGERKNNPRAGRESRVGSGDVEIDSTGLEQGKKLKPAVLRDIHHQKQVDDLRSLLTDAVLAEGDTAEGIWDKIGQSLEQLGVTGPDVQQVCAPRCRAYRRKPQLEIPAGR